MLSGLISLGSLHAGAAATRQRAAVAAQRAAHHFLEETWHTPRRHDTRVMVCRSCMCLPCQQCRVCTCSPALGAHGAASRAACGAHVTWVKNKALRSCALHAQARVSAPRATPRVCAWRAGQRGRGAPAAGRGRRRQRQADRRVHAAGARQLEGAHRGRAPAAGARRQLPGAPHPTLSLMRGPRACTRCGGVTGARPA